MVVLRDPSDNICPISTNAIACRFDMFRIALALLFVVLASSPSVAAKRIALVIGNSNYAKVTPLPNPKNDAAAMVSLFEKSGFEVVSKSDLSIEDMRKTMRDFAEASSNADVAVIYYAGHGIEIDGVNYLLPVDAKLQRDVDVEDETVSLERFMRSIETAKSLKLVILDACRDNPFAQGMKRSVSTRSVGRGLAKIEPASSNTLVAYAAKAGSTATDGDGANSPFALALLKNLTVPGLDLRIAMGKVRDEVMTATSRRQEPFVYGSLGGSLVSLVPVNTADDVAPANADNMRRDYELAVQVGTPQAFESFLESFPTGFYANLARSQLAKVKAVKDAEREAAEARAKAESAAAASARGSDNGSKATNAVEARRAKIDAEKKEKAAAVAERARKRESDRASKQASRASSDDASSVAKPDRQSRGVGMAGVVSAVPAPYSLRPGTRVLINNGECPSGQLLEMIAGHPQQGIKRSFRCVAR